MPVALFAVEQFATDHVVSVLQQENIEVVTRKLSSNLEPMCHVEKAVIIYPSQGVVAIGEQTAVVRELLGHQSQVILCTAQPSPSDRKLLQGCGASDVISPRSWSPSHVAERILAELILAKDIQPSCFGFLLGATRPMRKLYEEIATFAPLDEPVLILGETGTGKELVARELHIQSGRTGQFLPILCPAISPELLPSELFGHKEGSFTDARHNRKGMLVEAARGTAFLDEIGDLDSKAQAQLLRVLEDRRVKPVGSNTWEEINARIIMATNRNLEQDCAEGRFRYDLYMRLQGFALQLPPLRERLADLSLLAHYFVDAWGEEHATKPKIPPGALDCLFGYNWPGNVRELRKVIERACAFADRTSQNISGVMMRDWVTLHNSGTIGYTVGFDPCVDTLREVVKRAERQYIRAVLDLEKGNKEAAAKRAELSRSQFYEKLKEVQKN